MNALDIIKQTKIVPIVTVENVKDLFPILDILKRNGINIVEICFRNSSAAVSIKVANQNYPDMLIGAGTVLNKKQCLTAIECGAKFIVSPGFSMRVYKLCKKHNVPYIPGVFTPSEIMNTLELGIDIVKIYPVNIYGGLKMLKSLGQAFPGIKFLPADGVDNTNLKEFLEYNQIFACGGTWLTDGSLSEINQKVEEASKIITNLKQL